MGGNGAERAANGIEQRSGLEAGADVVDEAGDAPAGGLRGFGMADPAQHLLGAVGGSGGKAAGLELGKCDALVIGEAGVAGSPDGPADGLWELSAARLGLAHLADGGGEHLDDVETVDRDGGP